MASVGDLVQLFGPPPVRESSPDDWAEVESYIGSALPRDFKAFLDAYGTGVISGELVVFHPSGPSPLLERMRQVHETFGRSWRRDSDEYPFRFHPDPDGLISWGYDYFGDEHFFWPCDPDPDRWKIVTNSDGVDPEVFDGPFSDFVLAFAERMRDVDPHYGIDPDALEFLEPEDLNELAERGEIGPVTPSFEPF
ncbi:SMI1/KNR4 family protein [Streptomyces flavochromogenes]|uniref:SMI1/KNR4 family protein n=1 Tax=Streptomyces flavochromogenes TaxID=68199 RepID=A0ABW6XX20_9ACTN|nr:SMI1/KNR4 family protein [Streptomyces flavochromogenes]